MMPSLPYVPKSEFDRLLAKARDEKTKVSAFASFCRLNTLYMIRKAGSGHIGSSFSSLDIVSWVLLQELRRYPESGEFQDVYFSSKGHDVPGLYAALAGVGVIPFDMIHRLRRLGGLPGHPDVHTPGIPANTGSLGMGISKAKGMILADRLSGRDRRIYVMTGDGELQEGQIWESLASAFNRKMGELTVIVDHNKLQSDIWVHKTSDLGDLEAKFAAFGWHVQRADGHDFSALSSALAKSRELTEKPSVIIADTVKGKGVSFFEHSVSSDDTSLYRFHSGAPDMETCRSAMDELLEHVKWAATQAGLPELAMTAGEIELPVVPSPPPQRLISAYAEALVEQGRKRSDLVVLDADLKLDCGLIPIEREFPERFIECGIAEQDMVSQAGGLALSGMLPVVHSFACFLTPRANEQIYNNATEGTRIIYVGSLAGIIPSGPGHSHQSVRDISTLAAVPGLTLIEPCCEAEVTMTLDWAVNKTPGSTYIRLVSIPCEITFSLPSGYSLEEGRGAVLCEGKDAVIFASGPVLVEQAWRAAGMLVKENVSVTVVSLPWMNIVDQKWLSGVIKGHRFMLALDNHLTTGGQGSMLATAIAESGMKHKLDVVLKGLKSVPACGLNDEILQRHGLNSDSICSYLISHIVV